VNDDVLSKSKVQHGKLVVPSGAEYEALVLPVDNPELRKRFSGVPILTGDIAPDQAPGRWKFGDAEFRFYFYDTDFSKGYALGPGSFERWDATTGQVTAYTQSGIELAPGKAALILKK